MAQIKVDDVSKIYSIDRQLIPAVENVSLEIEKGDFLSIVGHSGSGKTTLISLIGGITRPTSGKILFEGDDICSLDDRRLCAYRNAKIGFIFQFASLLPMLTAKENVLTPAFFNINGRRPDEQAAAHCLEMVGLADKIGRYPSQLSGGQQRRVAIARALMNAPDVILADEPTGDLDEETEREIIDLFRLLNKERQITFIMVTHSSVLAAEGNQTLRMTKGRFPGDNR